MGFALSNWPDIMSAFISILTAFLIVLLTIAWFWVKKYINSIESRLETLEKSLAEKEIELRKAITNECSKLVDSKDYEINHNKLAEEVKKMAEEFVIGDEMFGTIQGTLSDLKNVMGSTDKKLNAIGRALMVTSKTLVKLCEHDEDMDCADVKSLADKLDDVQWKDLD